MSQGLGFGLAAMLAESQPTSAQLLEGEARLRALFGDGIAAYHQEPWGTESR